MHSHIGKGHAAGAHVAHVHKHPKRVGVTAGRAIKPLAAIKGIKR
jgi:hypothetical protein